MPTRNYCMPTLFHFTRFDRRSPKNAKRHCLANLADRPGIRSNRTPTRTNPGTIDSIRKRVVFCVFRSFSIGSTLNEWYADPTALSSAPFARSYGKSGILRRLSGTLRLSRHQEYCITFAKRMQSLGWLTSSDLRIIAEMPGL